jgi:hypothetical protein
MKTNPATDPSGEACLARLSEGYCPIPDHGPLELSGGLKWWCEECSCGYERVNHRSLISGIDFTAGVAISARGGDRYFSTWVSDELVTNATADGATILLYNRHRLLAHRQNRMLQSADGSHAAHNEQPEY